MAYGTYKQGGQGGKKGRTNMTHWTDSKDIQRAFYRKERRKWRSLLKALPFKLNGPYDL